MFGKFVSFSYITNRENLFAKIKSRLDSTSKTLQSDSMESADCFTKMNACLKNTSEQIDNKIKQFQEFRVNDSIQPSLWEDIIDRLDKNTDKYFSLSRHLRNQNILLISQKSLLANTRKGIRIFDRPVQARDDRADIKCLILSAGTGHLKPTACDDSIPLMFSADQRKAKTRMGKRIIKIALFIIGIALFAGAILSKSVTSFLTSLIGVSNTDDLPQTVVTLILLILALIFIFWSLHNSEAIRSILISKKLEDELKEFEEQVNETIEGLKEGSKKQKDEYAVLSEDVVNKLRKLEGMYTEKIHELQIEAMGKAQEFIVGSKDEIYKYKLSLTEKIVRFEGNIAELEQKCSDNDRLIEQLAFYKKVILVDD